MSKIENAIRDGLRVPFKVMVANALFRRGRWVDKQCAAPVADECMQSSGWGCVTTVRHTSPSEVSLSVGETTSDIVTSAEEEVMFLVQSVCLSVCLLVCLSVGLLANL